LNSIPPQFHHHSIRLKDYDYTHPGAYFVTLLTFNRDCILAKIDKDSVILSDIGLLVSTLWQALPNHFRLSLGEWVVMPNHLHGILILEDGGILDDPSANKQPENPGGRPKGTASGSLSAIVQNFKATTTRRANGIWDLAGKPLWQRNYFEHIIRGEKDWDTIHRYIASNPIRWAEDENHQ